MFSVLTHFAFKMLKCTLHLSQCEWLFNEFRIEWPGAGPLPCSLHSPTMKETLCNLQGTSKSCPGVFAYAFPSGSCLCYSLSDLTILYGLRSQLKGPFSYCIHTALINYVYIVNLLQIFLPEIAKIISLTQVHNTGAGNNKHQRKFQMSTV